MPVPIPGLTFESDSQKVKLLTIFGRPKSGIFRGFRGVPGGPKALDMDTLAARTNRARPLGWMSGRVAFYVFKTFGNGLGAAEKAFWNQNEPFSN